jgi:hypothetical protein
MDSIPEGMDAYRAWRTVPRDVRRNYTTGRSADADHAAAALGYARFALTPLGFVVYLGAAIAVLIGVMLAMAALEIGPDGADIAILSGFTVLLTVNHVRTAISVRKAATWRLAQDRD